VQELAQIALHGSMQFVHGRECTQKKLK